MSWTVACFCGNVYTAPPDRCRVCGNSIDHPGEHGQSSTGARPRARDLAIPPRPFVAVDASRRECRGNLAVHPGSVVLFTEMVDDIVQQMANR